MLPLVTFNVPETARRYARPLQESTKDQRDFEEGKIDGLIIEKMKGIVA